MWKRWSFLAAASIICLLSAEANCVWGQTERPIPAILSDNGKFTFLVDGNPFLILGGQTHNSSATTAEDLKAPMDSVVAIHGNTVEVPVYWELLEPAEGQFDFAMVDNIVEQARAHQLRVVLLWFGTWKNAWMNYTPEWVKRDTNRFKRARDANGQEMGTISAFCREAQAADARAFEALLRHVREKDSVNRTVIMVQVENETGLLETDRDHRPEANELYAGAPPAELLNYLGEHRNSLAPPLRQVMSKSSGSKRATWSDYFGLLAPEVFSAWYTARYVDGVAAMGKRVYPLPMYANDWLIGHGDERAGRWPSGGPTANVIDVWKSAAPHLDLVAPDVYGPYFEETAKSYARGDNALFVPEINPQPSFSAIPMIAIAGFNGIGASSFGVDEFYRGGSLSPAAVAFATNFEILAKLTQLITKYQYSGRLHLIEQDMSAAEVVPLSLDENSVAIFSFAKPFDPKAAPGTGLLIELAKDDYLVAGANFEVEFRAMEGPLRDRVPLTIEEGFFAGDQWIRTRRLNGDEFDARFPEAGRILRVRLLE